MDGKVVVMEPPPNNDDGDDAMGVEGGGGLVGVVSWVWGVGGGHEEEEG